jgi:DUF971 family protein
VLSLNGLVRASEDVEVLDIHSMAYGAQLVFSDGHARGIFPWPLLETRGDRRGMT